MNVDRPRVNTLGIFAGSGFHDTGVELALDALGYRVRPVGYIERDAAAAATLLARMGTQTLGRAPVWCDCISRVDAKPLRGFVDLLIASPPCQPYSSAGKRLGTKDHRSHGDGDGPLVHLARIFDECRPAVGWFENVPEWFTGGHFREFGEQLCRMGYDIQEPIFATSAGLGNVHERERVFCMVHAEHLRRWPREPREQEQAGRRRRDRLANAGSELADADGGRLEADGLKRGRKGPRVRRDAERSLEEVALTSRGGLGAGLCVPLCPPGRDDYGAWARLAAQGLDTTYFPAIESGLSVVADAVSPSASDLLRIGGNGVDPLVVADAFLRAVARLRGGP